MTVHAFHVERRPDWTCKGCELPNSWPCPAARAELLRDFGCSRTTLRFILSMKMYDAINDAHGQPRLGPVPDLYERFLGWVPQASSAALG
jgi:hypothetical protein